MSVKFISQVLISTLIALVVLVSMTAVFFAEDMNWTSLHRMQQRHFYGQLLNATNHPVKIIESKRLYPVPPWKTGLEINIHDTDGFVIDFPIQIDGKTVDKGVFKICDFAHVIIRSTPKGDVLETNKGTVLCRLMGDYGLFDDLDEAFGKYR
jgi:hypothetical protein